MGRCGREAMPLVCLLPRANPSAMAAATAAVAGSGALRDIQGVYARCAGSMSMADAVKKAGEGWIRAFEIHTLHTVKRICIAGSIGIMMIE